MNSILIYSQVLFPWLVYLFVKKYGTRATYCLPAQWYMGMLKVTTHGPTLSIYIHGIEIRFIGWSPLTNRWWRKEPLSRRVNSIISIGH